VDGYTPIEWGLVFSLLLLSGIDLVLTLAHVEAGGGEANPLMAWVFATGGESGFAAAKILLTGSATVFLLLHVRFRLARHALKALVSVYFVLLGWHAFVALDCLTL
jgi:hypothetical protein